MLKLIVGLGNPGKQYDGTPHNIGFDVLDLLARDLRAEPFAERGRYKSLVSEVALPGGGGKVTLMKPTTYMNLSGDAVGIWRQKNGADPNQILVICDDVNIELGTQRLRPSGSDGGQKGLRHIIEVVGSQQIPRLRLGIRPMGVDKVPDLTAYVLHKWWGTARDVAAEAARLGADTVGHLLRTDNMAQTMSLYNNKRIELEPKEKS